MPSMSPCSMRESAMRQPRTGSTPVKTMSLLSLAFKISLFAFMKSSSSVRKSLPKKKTSLGSAMLSDEVSLRRTRRLLQSPVGASFMVTDGWQIKRQRGMKKCFERVLAFTLSVERLETWSPRIPDSPTTLVTHHVTQVAQNDGRKSVSTLCKFNQTQLVCLIILTSFGQILQNRTLANPHSGIQVPDHEPDWP